MVVKSGRSPLWSKKTWKNIQRGKKILPGNGGKVHNGAKKRALKRDKFTCQRCGVKLFDKDSKRTRDKRKAILHHIVPPSEGGTNGFDNLLSTCRECEDLHHDMGTTPVSGYCTRPLTHGISS